MTTKFTLTYFTTPDGLSAHRDAYHSALSSCTCVEHTLHIEDNTSSDNCYYCMVEDL